jgi:hypothetical protein
MLHLTAYLSDRFNRLIDEPISKERRKRNLSKNIRLLRLNGGWIPSDRGLLYDPLGRWRFGLLGRVYVNLKRVWKELWLVKKVQGFR